MPKRQCTSALRRLLIRCVGEFKKAMGAAQTNGLAQSTPALLTTHHSGDFSKKILHDRIGYKFEAHEPKEDIGIEVSILAGCSRYLQRFRVFAQSICRQQFDLDKVEVIVANPQSPDGLSTYLSLLRAAEIRPAFEEVLLDTTHYRNRGMMMQKAFEHARGKIVIGMDCDLVLQRISFNASSKRYGKIPIASSAFTGTFFRGRQRPLY